MHDVVVVGAGPAGLMSASLLEKEGLDVVVLDRKREVGLPVQCSGLISRNLDRFVKPPKSCIEHRVRAALVHGPGKREIRLEKSGTAAYVIDRQGFDSFLASRVRDVRMGTEVRSLAIERDSVMVKTSKGEIRARTLLGCDGPSSVVRKHFGVKPVELLQGIIAIEDKNDDSDCVEMWLDRKLCDGFLWRIPRGESVEYGMLGSRVSFSQLERFFKLPKGVEKRAGMIPIGPCKSYFKRTLLVGDAAAQTKPWSGGGVIYGFTCAGHAARTIKQAIKREDLSEKALEGYEEAWKAELGRPIQLGMMGRELYKKMDNEQLGGFMDKAAGMDLSRLDMDFPSLGFM